MEFKKEKNSKIIFQWFMFTAAMIVLYGFLEICLTYLKTK